jgi:hypothetical protein
MTILKKRKLFYKEFKIGYMSFSIYWLNNKWDINLTLNSGNW